MSGVLYARLAAANSSRDRLLAEWLDREHAPVAVDHVKPAAGAERAPELDERRMEVVQVLEHVLGDRAIEARVVDGDPIVRQAMKAHPLAHSLGRRMLLRPRQEGSVHVYGVDVPLRSHAPGELNRHPARPAAIIENRLSARDVCGREQRVHLRSPAKHLIVGFEALRVDRQPVIVIVRFGVFHRRWFWQNSGSLSRRAQMTQPIPSQFLDLFQKKAFASLATVMPDGTPQVTPVWVDYDGERVIVNSARGRRKDRNMKVGVSVALSIMDPDNAYRHLQVRGRVSEVTEQGADAHIDRMAKKYLGKDKYPFRQPGEVRVLYKITPSSSSGM